MDRTLARGESITGAEERFDLVVFSSCKVEETAPYLGERRAWIREPTWKLLDHATVKTLVSRKA
jgi:hypothetical protein